MELDKELWDKKLILKGPFSFRHESNSCIFKKMKDGRNSAGVYLLTIRSDLDKNYYIHYIGEAQNIVERQLEHLINVLGLFYGIWDVKKSRQIKLGKTWESEDAKKVKQGKLGIIWEGLWRFQRPKSSVPISDIDLLGEYERLHEDIISYVGSIDIFFANTEEFKKSEEPIDSKELKKIRQAYDRKRKDIEGSIADRLESYSPEARENISALYPRDNATGVSKHRNDPLRIYFPKDVIIMGLNHEREKVNLEGCQEFVELKIE